MYSTFSSQCVLVARPLAFFRVALRIDLMLIVACLTGLSTAATAASLLVFGDSLSDTNAFTFPASDYYTGRWSNGTLWEEKLPSLSGLPSQLNKTLTEYAVAGTTTSDLQAQINNVSASMDWANATCIIWSGGNDMINNGSVTDSNTWASIRQTAVTNITSAVQTLYNKGQLPNTGVRKIYVLNLPDMGKIPNFRGGSNAANLSTQSSLLNSELHASLASLLGSLPGLTLWEVDVFSKMNAVIASPSTYGFTNATSGALSALSDHSFTGAGANYLFWDNIHPTTKGHLTIAGWVKDQVATTVNPDIAVTQGSNVLTDNSAGITYGSVGVGATASAVFTIQNAGSTVLSGISLSKATTDNPGDFGLDTTGTLTSLAPGATTTFQISFTPTVAVLRKAQIKIASNDPDENPFEINVQGTGTALPSITLGVSPTSIWEDSGSSLDFTFSRTGATTSSLTVNFAVGGSALWNSDYVTGGGTTFATTSGSVTFAAGISTTHLFVAPVGDSNAESDETVSLTLTSNSNYAIGTGSPVTGTILDEQAPTTVTVVASPASVVEDSGAPITFTLTRQGPLINALPVNFALSGAASVGSDYTLGGTSSLNGSNGAVTFASGANTATVTLQPVTDAVQEADETATVTLTSGSNYTVGSPGSASGTITNDDLSPVISIEAGGTPLTRGTVLDIGGANVGGTVRSRPLTIKNTGAANLTGIAFTSSGDFSVDATGMKTQLAPNETTTFVLVLTPAAAGVRSGGVNISSNDTVFNLSLSGFGVALQNLGPDSFGYRATNNTLSTFTDISDTGTPVLDSDGDNATAIPVGFPFKFYGTSYSTAFVSTKATLTFASANWSYANQNLATSSFGQPVIAVLWDDWATNLSSTDRVYYETSGSSGSRVCTVQWHLNPYGGPVGEQIVQCRLFEATGVVQMNYKTVSAGGAVAWGQSATVGIQDTGGNSNGRVLQWSYNAMQVFSGLSLVFTPPNTAPAITPQFTPPTILEGQSITLPFLVNDAEQALDYLTVSATSSNQSLVADNGISLGGSAGNRTVSLNPVGDAFGTSTITLTVSDGITTKDYSFLLTVTAVNDAPSFTAGSNVTVAASASGQIIPVWATNLSAGPANEASQALDFIVTTNNNGLFSTLPTISSGGTLIFAPLSTAGGSATVSVRIHDNGGTANGGVDMSGTQTFTLTVVPTTVNQSGAINSPIGGYLIVAPLAGMTQTYNNSGYDIYLGPSGYSSVGDTGIGIMNQTAGTHSTFLLYVGNNSGSVGTYNQSGGAVQVYGAFTMIGNGGSGTYDQTGGTHYTPQMIIGSGATGLFKERGGALTVNGPLYVGASVTGTLDESSGAVSAATVIIGGGANAQGFYTLSGGSLNTGTVVLGQAGAGTLTINGGSLSAGSIQTGTGNRRLVFSNGTISTSALTLDLGAAGLVIGDGSNAATLTLTGGTHSVANGVHVKNAGALSLSSAQLTSSVMLEGGALAGNGGVGDLSATSGSVIDPGSITASTVATGTIALSPGVTYKVDLINGASDQLNVIGTVSLANATLTTTLRSVPTGGQVFTIIQNDGTEAVNGTFNGLPDFSILTLTNVGAGGGTYKARISYRGGTGNDVTLTIIDLPIVSLGTVQFGPLPSAVQLRGTVDPNGGTAQPTFVYGTTLGSYPSTAFTGPPSIFGSAQNVFGDLSLTPNATYYYQLRATNEAGTKSTTEGTFRVPNNVATLSSIGLSSGSLSPAFAPNQPHYSVYLPNATSTLSITPAVPAGSNAKIQFNGQDVSSGSTQGPLNLSVGTTYSYLRVTAENGFDFNWYDLAVTRSAGGADLTDISTSYGSLSPSFSSSVTNYNVTVSNATSNFYITPQGVDAGCTVQTRLNGGSFSSVTPNTQVGPFALSVGNNTLDIKVTTAGGVTKIYSLAVRRRSADATLASLSVTNGIALAPAFASNGLTYSATVPYEITDTTISATTTNAMASVSGTGAKTIAQGPNTMNVVVSAEDGNTQTYTITITRSAPLTIATLSNLALTGGTLSPGFANSAQTYTASILYTTAASVSATLSEGHASVLIKLNGNFIASGTTTSPVTTPTLNLQVGANTLECEVTAQDGVTKKTYTVTLTRTVADIAVFNGSEFYSGSSSFSFGYVALGNTKSQTFTIKNVGTEPLTKLQVASSSTPASDGQFSTDTTGIAASLAPGETTTFVVTMHSDQRWFRYGYINIATNDPDENPFALAVSGNGVPGLSFDQPSQQLLENVKTITLPVRLSETSGTAFTVPVYYSGSATNATDYTRSTSLLSFTATQTVANITISIKDDLVVEGDETIVIDLGTPSIASIGLGTPAQHTITLLEDDVMPVIAPQPAGKVVAVGGRVEFVSGATGSDPLTLQWKKNGTALAGATGGSLTLDPVVLADGAAYTLTATNTRGSVTSTAAQLGVVDAAPGLVRANVGSTVTMTVNTTGKGLTYQWMKGAVALVNSTKIAGAATKSLTLKSLTVDDGGAYTCVVAGAGGSLETGVRDLQVPSIRPVPLNVDFPDVVLSNSYSYQIPFSDDRTAAPTAFSCSGLPSGLTCNPTTGLVTGTPKVTGTFRVVARLSNSSGFIDAPEDTLTVKAYPVGVLGTYVGLLTRHDQVNANLGGRIDITPTSSGAYTGTLWLGASSYSLKGMLSMATAAGAHPTAQFNIARSGLPGVTVSLDIDPTNDNLTGTASVASSSSVAAVAGWRNVWHTSAPANLVSAQVGTQAFKLQPVIAAVSGEPQGYGYGSIAVTPAGATTVSGRTADGGTVLSNGFMGPDGEVLIYQILNSNVGSLIGSARIDDSTNQLITGVLDWRKTPAAASVRDYRSGFGPIAVDISGGKYTVAAPILGFTDTPVGTNNARLTFTLGGVERSQINPNIAFRVSNTNTLTKPTGSVLNPGSTTLTINTKTGLFNGTFTLVDPPSVKRVVDFQGWLVPTEGKGFGWFMLPQLADPLALPPTTSATSPILSGRVVLEALPP